VVPLNGHAGPLAALARAPGGTVIPLVSVAGLHGLDAEAAAAPEPEVAGPTAYRPGRLAGGRGRAKKAKKVKLKAEAPPKKKPRKPARKAPNSGRLAAPEKPVRNSLDLAAIRRAWEPGKR
jgi:hypothetical protein